MIWKRENWKSLVLLSTLFYGAGLAREIFKSPWWCDWGVSPHLTPSPFQRGWRRLNSLFFPSSLASGRAESKLHRQVLPPPPRSVQALDAEASLTQHLLSLHGPSDHASTPGAAHTTGPGAAEQTARSAAWCHWTELGARVGGPRLLGTLEVVTEALGGGRGQGPHSKRQAAPRPSLGLHQYQTQRVLEDPVSASVPFKSGPQRPFGIMLGLRFSWEVSLHLGALRAPLLALCL
uniref:Uncharacterized protein n=1 Tax=Rousettus aegyptiacus TaxID=9407 RepID=A0A7J8C2R5_ROUAE|nr:hypothetical protein HJG63_009465 [Rousettus aegyptiacus]